MTLTKEKIQFLNRINSGAQKVGLGNLLAEIEAKAVSGGDPDALDLFREELDGILETIVGFEEQIKELPTRESVEAVEKSLSALTETVEKYILKPGQAPVSRKLKTDSA